MDKTEIEIRSELFYQHFGELVELDGRVEMKTSVLIEWCKANDFTLEEFQSKRKEIMSFIYKIPGKVSTEEKRILDLYAGGEAGTA